VAEGGGEERTADATGVTRAVFISYASQDAAATARICTALRQAGIVVWFDQSELRGGDVWDQRIRREIRDCTLFMPVISVNTALRHEGYFRLEWDLADQRTHMFARDRVFIVPVCLDTTADSGTDVPESFHRVQWTRLPEGETPPEFVARIARLLSPQPQPTVGVRQPAELAQNVARRPLVADRPASLRRSLSVIVGSLVAVALAWLVIDRPWSRGYGLSAAPAATGGIAAAPPVTTPAAPTSATFSPPPHSIAVLPFVNMSGDAKQDYFSDGISEELLDALSRLDQLHVVARTSSFSFKGQNVDTSTIAHKLNVGTILEGSVRRAGNTVRITVQLIDAASGYHLWSQTYDRKFTDILKIQTDVAATVAQQLKVTLIGDETAKFELGGTKNAEAYEAFLRGNEIINEITGGSGRSHRDALAAYDRAIALDPDYAKAYVARAWALHEIAFMEAEPGDRSTLREKARVSAERSVALAPDLGQAHAALAAIRAYALYDYFGAAPEFDRALALAPGSVNVQTAYAWYAADLGHLDAAENAARRAVSLNPQDVFSHELLGTILYYARQYPDALSVFKDAQLLAPNSKDIAASVLQTLLASGEIKRAQQGCESPATPMNDDDRHYCLALAYHALGRQSDAESELKKFQALDGDKAAGLYAGVYAQFKNAAAALRWLSKAEQLRDPILWTLKVDWHLDPIRNEPEFKAMLARMNFPP
jgi:TolB-like protein/Tfp pilus assembly protein PilF